MGTSSDTQSERPNVAEVLSRFLQDIQRAHQPLLIALAERMAAERYRSWATSAEGIRRTELLACADREEEIARHVEALYPDGSAAQREVSAKRSDLHAITQTLFAGRPIEEQFAIQAEGERLGAATWRSFARHEQGAKKRETFLTCAALEEESACVLESYLAGGRGDVT
jgi:hypothetical protein